MLHSKVDGVWMTQGGIDIVQYFFEYCTSFLFKSYIISSNITQYFFPHILHSIVAGVWMTQGGRMTAARHVSSLPPPSLPSSYHLIENTFTNIGEGVEASNFLYPPCPFLRLCVHVHNPCRYRLLVHDTPLLISPY